MLHNADAARARAEAIFKTPEPHAGALSQAERDAAAVREKTQRLREARLAQEATKRKGMEIRRKRLCGA